MSTNDFCMVPDLGVTVGASNAEVFRVSRAVLMLSSPVFAAMLHPGGPWCESKSGSLQLPGDDPKSFRLAMDIIHHQYERIPATISIDELTRLHIFAEKYEVGASIMHNTISSQWVMNFVQSALNGDIEVNPLLADEIAFTFGQSKEVESNEYRAE